MRVGTNPLKHKAVLPAYKRHRIVMPVYIPSREDYFEHALEIFRYSLESLLATVDPEHVDITVIDNASIPEVGALLEAAFAAGRIDRLVRNVVNRGKPDPVIAELRSSYERFVTIADSDVLFLPGWLAAVEDVYAAWPRAGAVSPGGQSKPAYYQNASTWLHGLARGQLKLDKFADDADLLQFARSVGNPELYSPAMLARQYALRRGGHTALVGAGHFVVTLRRAIYDGFTYTPRREGTGRGMRELDRPVDRQGYLRLATTRALVLHLGNTPEPWMREKLSQVLLERPRALRPASDAVLDARAPGRAKTPHAIRALLARPVMRLARMRQARP